jgi:hypothetical protein
VAGFEWRRGKVVEHGFVGDEPLPDRLLMPPGALVLTGETIFGEPLVQRRDRRRMRHRRQIIEAHELHQAFNLALVVPPARTSEAIGKEKMADQFREGMCALARAVADTWPSRKASVVSAA